MGLVKKPTMVLLEESDSSPPIVISSPLEVPTPSVKQTLFTDPALNTAFESLPFDEQMRILEMPNEQDRINALQPKV